MKKNAIEIFLGFFILILYQNSFAQEHLISLSATHVSQFGKGSDLVSFNPVSKLSSGTLSNRSVSATVKKLPKNQALKNPAYFFLYFGGAKQSVFGNEIAVLMDDYNSTTPTLYIDSNGNLDFTDDDPPLKLTNWAMVSLKNSDQSSRKFYYQLARSQVTPANAPRLESRYKAQFPNNELIPANLWITNQRLSVNISYSEISGQNITVLIQDSNADAAYTFDPDESGDRISIVEDHIDIERDLTEHLRSGEPIDHNAVFNLYGKKYRFRQIHSNELELASTDLDPKIFFKKGENISDFEIELLGGAKIKIADLLDGKKPLLIDVGGTWCGGCIAQEPIIKSLVKNSSVKVIGIFGHDTKERVEKYVKSHQLEWPVALMSDSFKETFRINSYPTYILVSSDGKIQFMTMSAENIADALK